MLESHVRCMRLGMSVFLYIRIPKYGQFEISPFNEIKKRLPSFVEINRTLPNFPAFYLKNLKSNFKFEYGNTDLPSLMPLT